MPVQQFAMMPDYDPGRSLTYYFDAVGDLDPGYYVSLGSIYARRLRLNQ